MTARHAVVIVLASSLMLTACMSGSSRAPVVRPGPTQGDVYDEYRVSRGDTLFSIAFRYGLDYRKLANANRISPPYTIYPNQLLVLRESETVIAMAVKPKPRPAGSKPIPSSKPKPTASTSTPKPTASVPMPNPGRWQWPASGKVVRAYGADGAHKGIDIGGKLGEPVRSAAPGRVVYAGDGILGYGNLLIVKHSDEYLSAYGHNDRLLVKEGTRVKAGQQIAEKGDSGTDSVKLHFEIRREGKPIDPVRLLPRR